MNRALVFQTDFGLVDGAVSAMYGVALSVDPTLRIFDLTHEITPFNLWEASYRLFQTVPYWPEGTVFVSVVDPSVGSKRSSIVAKTKGNRYIVTPNNGSLTHIEQTLGILEVREIDEKLHRLRNSEESHTFHGRDIFANVGAKLASGLDFTEVGRSLPLETIVRLPQANPVLTEMSVTGHVDILDVRFGNVWTNIEGKVLSSLEAQYGDAFEVTIVHEHRRVYKQKMTFGKSFADSRLGEPVLYINSVGYLGIALNQGSFAEAYRIGTGSNWQVTIRKLSEQEKAS